MSKQQQQPWRAVAERGGLALLLIRHGRTGLNAERRFCGGRSDPPLDEEGRAQVQRMVARLGGEAARVFCSPQARALESGAGLGELSVIEGLRELDQGALEGRRFDEALAEHRAFFGAWRRDPSELQVPGGGESMGQLAARVCEAVGEIFARLEGASGGVGEGGRGSWQRPPPSLDGQVLALVGHQMAQAAFVCAALDQPLRRWSEYQLGNARANLLAWEGGAWSLVAREL